MIVIFISEETVFYFLTKESSVSFIVEFFYLSKSLSNSLRYFFNPTILLFGMVHNSRSSLCKLI